MVKIKLEELVKSVKFLEQESLSGLINIKEDGASLKLSTTDRANKDIVVEISDTSYPKFVTVTRTERL